MHSLSVCYLHQGGFLIGLLPAHLDVPGYICPHEPQVAQTSCASYSQGAGQIPAPPMEDVSAQQMTKNPMTAYQQPVNINRMLQNFEEYKIHHSTHPSYLTFKHSVANDC
jgi:hypothetical protein